MLPRCRLSVLLLHAAVAAAHRQQLSQMILAAAAASVAAVLWRQKAGLWVRHERVLAWGDYGGIGVEGASRIGKAAEWGPLRR